MHRPGLVIPPKSERIITKTSISILRGSRKKKH